MANKTIIISDGHQHTQRTAIGIDYAFNPAEDTGAGVDIAAILASLAAEDTGAGVDVLSPVLATIYTSDDGAGNETSTAAKTFFLIDSRNVLQPLGVFVLKDSKEELLPKTRENTEEIPGRHGEIDFGSELQPRVMEFKVHINATPAEKSALKRKLAAYLNPLNGAKPLIDSQDIEKTYYVKYAGNIDLSNYVNAMQFTIPFKASDPIIYGSFEQTKVGSGIISNDGTLECPVVVKITGLVTNPSVTIGAHTLTYTGGLTSSDTLVIDTGALTATFNGVNALINLDGLTPDIVLPVGDTMVTAANGGTTVFSWRERFI